MSDETKAGKYLTFSLAEEDDGIVILKVREIIVCFAFVPVGY